MKSIQHARNAEFSRTSSVRLGDFHPPHRLRLVSPVQQLFPDGWPMLFQVVLQSDDGHPVDAWTTFIGPHLPQCCLQIFSLTYLLHQSIRAGWAFGFTRRHGRFRLFSRRLSGFTRQTRSPVPSGCSAACRPWASWPTGRSVSFGPSAIVPGLAYPLLRLSAFGVPH